MNMNLVLQQSEVLQGIFPANPEMAYFHIIVTKL